MFRIIYSIGEIEFSMKTERISLALAAIQGALQKEGYSQDIYEHYVAVVMKKLVEIYDRESYGADFGPIEIRRIDDEVRKEKIKQQTADAVVHFINKLEYEKEDE